MALKQTTSPATIVVYHFGKLLTIEALLNSSHGSENRMRGDQIMFDKILLVRSQMWLSSNPMFSLFSSRSKKVRWKGEGFSGPSR